MTLYAIHLGCALAIVIIAKRKSFEMSLPFACFVLVLAPASLDIDLIGFFDLSLQRTVTSILLLLFVFSTPQNEPLPVNDTGLKNFFIASIIANLLALSFSVAPLISAKRFIAEIVEYYLLYLIIVRSVTGTGTIHKIVIAMVAAMAISSFFGLLEAYTNWQVMPEQVGRFAERHGWEGVWRSDRVRSVFPHPILFGGAIAMIMPIALYLSTYFKKNSSKVILWFSISIMFLSIYKSMSRGPWLSLVCSLALIFLFSNREYRKPILIVGLLSLTTLLLRPGIWETVKNLAIVTFDPGTHKGASYSYRFALAEVIQRALSESSLRQLFGFGQGSFFYLNLVGEFQGRPYAFQSCDSAWLQFLSNTGYLGLVTMVALFGKVFLVIWSNLRKSTDSMRNFILSIFASLFGTYLLMASVALYGWGQNGHILWILIAICISYIRNANSGDSPKMAAQP
jgi:hypothetical protein